jgi:hypothetical protein
MSEELDDDELSDDKLESSPRSGERTFLCRERLCFLLRFSLRTFFLLLLLFFLYLRRSLCLSLVESSMDCWSWSTAGVTSPDVAACKLALSS